MHKYITSILTVVLLTAFCSSTIFAQDAKSFQYIGVKKCGMCHKKAEDGEQLKVWEKSKHAQAYKTLQSEKADKIAAGKGFKTKAVETPECLTCHTLGSNVDASMFDKKFDIADGVQCETCHGPGSEYKSKKVMENREESAKKGLIVFANEEEIKAQCVKCHNDKSPTHKEFDFKTRYAEIAHNIPDKKK